MQNKNQRNAYSSDYIHQSMEQASYYRKTPYGENSTQSWSQPVRNDEVPQSGPTNFGKVPKDHKHPVEKTKF